MAAGRAAPPALAPLALLALLSACAADGPSPPPPPPRNVVVVLADTLRAQSLGTYGYARDTSPNLSALAAEALVFEDVRAQAPCTYPSANSLLTGRDPSRFWVQPGRRIGIPEEQPSIAETLHDRGYATVAVSASPIVRASPTRFNPAGGFDRGFDVFDERCLFRDASCVNRIAFDYLSVLREPFFLYLHYMDPHDPYRPPERSWSDDGYDGRRDAVDLVVQGDPNPLTRGAEIGAADLDHLVALYDDEIAWFDGRLGELVEALRGRPEGLDDTLLAVVADHGEGFLEHGGFKHCRSLYDEEIRTPMVLRIPGTEGGRRIAGLAQNLDLVPTLLDYLGVEAPDLRLDGASLRPLIERGEPVHEHVVSSWGALRSVRSGRFKLIVDLATGRTELYDVEADPGEIRNLADENPREVRRLQRAMSAWIREVEGMAGTEEALEEARTAAERLRDLGYIR